MYRKNELKKKNFVFFQTILLSWKKMQLRAKRLKKVSLLIILTKLKYILTAEIKKKKQMLAPFVNTLLFFLFIKKVRIIFLLLAERESILRVLRNIAGNSWFVNNNVYSTLLF